MIKSKHAPHVQNAVIALWVVMVLTNVALVVALAYLGSVDKTLTDSHRAEAELVRIGAQLAKASDLLTEAARGFAVSNDPRYLQTYWEEVDATQVREKALDKLQRLSAVPEEAALLKEAKLHSDQLMGTEIQSMKLILEAYNVTNEATDTNIASFQLDPEEASLSSEDKLRRAQTILFNQEYRDLKKRITGPIATYQKGLRSRMEAATHEAFYAQTVVRNVCLALSIVLLIMLVMLVWLRLLNVRRLHHEEKNS